MSGLPLPTLAVVIPTLNEEPVLAATLRSLRDQTRPADRVVVVDGGSRDRTAEVARSFGVELLFAGVTGRGNQVAAGVEAVTETVAVVGHADMLFPAEALERVCRVLQDEPGCPGGALGHRFASPRWEYRVVEWFDARRARRGHAYGDQAQFFRREVLAAAGGFPAQPILEDVELAARLRTLGRTAYLDCPVSVSPRRFERLGMVRTLWQNWRFRRAYRRGGIAATRAIFDRYYPTQQDEPCPSQPSPTTPTTRDSSRTPTRPTG